MIKILLNAYLTVRDWIADGLKWLRLPGAKLKALCGVLSLVCIVGAFDAFEQRNIAATLRVDNVRCVGQVHMLEQDIEGWARSTAEIAAALAAEAEALVEAKARAKAAQNALVAEQERIDLERKVFEQRYKERPQECAAALQLLDAACESLGGY